MKNEENNKAHNLNNGWEKLCEVYGNRTFLNSFKVKESQTELVLVQGNIYKIGTIMLFIPGSFLFAFGLSFFFPSFGFKGFLDIFCCFIGVVGGGAMLCFGILLALPRNKITFNKLTSLATIRYGFFPFGKRVICQSEKLKLRLYQIDIHQATEFLDMGDSVLSISHFQNDLELIIGTNKQRDILSKAHKKITKFIGAEIVDDTWSEYELPEGKTIHFQKTAIAKDREQENFRVYTELSSDVVVWKRHRKGCWVWILSMPIGASFISFPFWVPQDISEFAFIAILALPLGLFMFCGSVYFLTGYWKNRLIVIDKAHDTIQYRSTQRGFGNKKEICKISDIAFFQLCFCAEESIGVSRSGVFELNCVDKNGIRFNLCNNKNGVILFENANQLSDRLKIPLVDSVPWQ